MICPGVASPECRPGRGTTVRAAVPHRWRRSRLAAPLRVACCLFVVLVASGVPPALAQDPPDSDRSSWNEELEPRIVGRRGMLRVDLGGYLDSVYAADDANPINLTLLGGVSRFFTDRVAFGGGLQGTARLGGDSGGDEVGATAPALHATVGGAFYFSPQSIASFYVGADYWIQLTNREEGDAGSLVGKGGVEGALSSRATVFVEAGYGIGFTAADGLPRRLVGRAGMRVTF
ncbi:MAG: hypothetical protein AB7O67_02465 [Vicinamibacterales bacterium]